MSALAFALPNLSAHDRIRVQAIIQDMERFGFDVKPGRMNVWVINRHGDYVTTIDTVDQLAHFAAGVRSALGDRKDAIARVEALVERAHDAGDVSVLTEHIRKAIAGAITS